MDLIFINVKFLSLKILTFGILGLIVNASVIFGDSVDPNIFNFQNHQKITFILIHSDSKKRG